MGLLLAGCGSNEEEHSHGEDADHSHEQTVQETEQGSESEEEHAHDSEGNHIEQQSEKVGSGIITQWTEKTELFMEYPELIVGEEATFAVHLTRLSDFRAISESEVEFVFRSERGMEGSLTETEVQIPGIYGPDVIFDRAGRYDLTIIIRGMVDDTLQINGIPVYNSVDEIPSYSQEEDPSLISFLKEQQWKIPFGTQRVSLKSLTTTIDAHGEIAARSNGQAVVSAPFSGIILPTLNTNLPVIGNKITKGKSVVVLNPAIQSADGENYAQQFINARAELELARKNLERQKRLFEREAIPEVELDKARIEYRRARIQFQTINEIVQVDTSSVDTYGDSEESYRFALKAPISGAFLETYVTPGMQVNVGDPLFLIADMSKVWLHVHVPASERNSLSASGSASFSIQGDDHLYDLNDLNGRLVSTGKSVDSKTRTVSLIYEIDNPKQSLQTGLFANVYVDTEQKEQTVAVPESSLIEEEGSFFVFVHVAGESFEKRRVTTGIRDRGMIEITSGLNIGEHVVTVNPYQVKLASLSSEAPAHGHAH
jgi:RND family efflux transporter MFP subunit